MPIETRTPGNGEGENEEVPQEADFWQGRLDETRSQMDPGIRHSFLSDMLGEEPVVGRVYDVKVAVLPPFGDFTSKTKVVPKKIMIEKGFFPTVVDERSLEDRAR